ncbi:MAG: hypothetical protein ACI9DC_004035 [Gammaproteobacteria bacterium]|jgi:hypothetical protein
MTAFYMVELAFPFPDERTGFDQFYSGHIDMLLSIEGLDSAQRFEASHEATAPFMAIYELAHEGVLRTSAYTSRAGPNSVTERYRPKMLNWKRNVVTGPSLRLDVPVDGWLMLVDRITENSAPLPEGFVSFKAVDLDKTFVERGIASGDGEPPSVEQQADWVVRTMKPLHARRES